MRSSLLQLTARIARLLPQSLRNLLYRLGPISDVLRSMLTRAAPDEIVPVDIAAGPLAGIRMELDLQAEKEFWLGTYEPELLEAIFHFTDPGQTVFDIGANIGYVSLAMAVAVGAGGTVVAFEPLPANVARLETNLALNPAGARVQIVAAAAGAHGAEDAFLVHASGKMGKLKNSLGRDAEYEGTLMVEVIALDEWLATAAVSPPSLIKVDIEGGEGEALKGMRRILENDRPTLLVELHGQEAARTAREVLVSSGYSLREMRSGYPELGEFQEWKINAVALPE